MYCDVMVYVYLDCSSGLFYEPCVFASQSSYMYHLVKSESVASTDLCNKVPTGAG